MTYTVELKCGLKCIKEAKRLSERHGTVGAKEEILQCLHHALRKFEEGKTYTPLSLSARYYYAYGRACHYIAVVMDSSLENDIRMEDSVLRDRELYRASRSNRPANIPGRCMSSNEFDQRHEEIKSYLRKAEEAFKQASKRDQFFTSYRYVYDWYVLTSERGEFPELKGSDDDPYQ